LEWEPDNNIAWVQDAERWISQIHGVRHCKIDLDREGEITGVHVVAGMEREPRHIVRDVEGLLKARLGVSVFYKKIGVVQVMDSEPETDAETEPLDRGELQAASAASSSADPSVEPAPAPHLRPLAAEAAAEAVLLEEAAAPRLLCSGVGVMASETTIRAEVDLCAGEVEVRGAEEGPNREDGDLHVVARAALAALSELLDEPILLSLSEVRLQQVAEQPLALVAVELVEGRRSERLFGTCPARHNRQQAVVYAILDALNRRLAMMGIRTGEVVG
jgi:hypothetical protein